MKGEALRYIVSGILLLFIGLVAMSMIGLTFWNGLCTLLGAVELVYATYISLK